MRALSLFCQLGLIGFSSCSRPAETEPEPAPERALEARAPRSTEDEWSWSWYTATAERRTFSVGTLSASKLEPLDHDVRVAPLSATEAVVAIGPVGEWYANDTYYVHIALDEPRVLGLANYVSSDVTVYSGWAEPCGRVAIERVMVEGEPRLRLELALTSEDGEPWINGVVTASPLQDSPTLRAELSTPGLPFAVD